MGSFSELTLAFTFAADTPAEVLGAFAPWAVGENAPSLPTLEQSLPPEELDRLETHFQDYITDDLMRPLPPLHQAVGWRALLQWGDNAYFPGTPSSALRWDRYGTQWTLSIRTLPKMGAAEIQAIVAPLGEFATEGTPDRPRFVGYVDDEHLARPVLIWSAGTGPFRFEVPDEVS